MIAPMLALAMMQQGTSLYLYNTCQSAVRMMDAPKPDPRDIPGANYCIGYVEGFIDGSGTMRRGSCMPEQTHTGTVIRAFVAYMVRHPEEKSYDQRLSLLFALADAYPCPVKK
jgi:hypothetical protein